MLPQALQFLQVLLFNSLVLKIGLNALDYIVNDCAIGRRLSGSSAEGGGGQQVWEASVAPAFGNGRAGRGGMTTYNHAVAHFGVWPRRSRRTGEQGRAIDGRQRWEG